MKDVYVVNADGGGLRRLTSHPNNDFDPSWSPDGRRLAFRSERDGNNEIYVMNADGSRQRNVSITCTIGRMASGAVVTITLTIKPTTKGAFTDTATVSATSPGDKVPANNTSSVTTQVRP